jgi:predicted Fe-Mo cluster-binding NifX family protein
MKAAVTVWNNRISPVFDVSKLLMVAEVIDHKVIRVHYEPMDSDSSARTAERLAKIGVTVLICGAISQKPALILEAAGIRLIPFVTGKADRVIDAFAEGRAIIPQFLMPGCGRRRRCCDGSSENHMAPGPSEKGSGEKR